MGLPRSSYYRLSRGYRHYRPAVEPVPQKDRSQPAALDAEERAAITAVLTAKEYAECSVVQTYWRAVDAGQVACSQRTFYRVARSLNMVGDRRRRNRSTTPPRTAPIVTASAVGELWSWDITELRGRRRQDKYYLYLVIDVFSRYPVGWCVNHTESKHHAVTMFADAITTHGIPTVVHADNGSSMRSQTLVDALHKDGIVTSYSRPRVSDDNPFSEALFKTVKYDLEFPETFDDIDHARRWVALYLNRYATNHRHSGLGRHTPATIHNGTAEQIQQRRQQHLDDYWAQHPQRFRRRPTTPPMPQTTGINTHLLSHAG